MKTLLALMLIHYYLDGKRSTSAAITRKLDTRIRAIVSADPSLSPLLISCKKAAETVKRKRRHADRQLVKMNYHRPNPGVKHVPCGKARG